MKKCIAIDYGLKKSGLAISDPTLTFAFPLKCILSHSLLEYLQTFFQSENIDTIILGLPKNLNNTPTDVTDEVVKLAKKIRTCFSDKKVIFWDERFTSKIAMKTPGYLNMKKKERRKKKILDVISAKIILQDYLDYCKQSVSPS